MTTRRDFLRRGAQSAALLGIAAQGATECAAAQPADALQKDKPLRPSPLDVDRSNSELRPWFDRFLSDQELLLRYYSIPFAPKSRERMRSFYTLWQAELAALPFAPLSQDARVDYLLLRNKLLYELRTAEQDQAFQHRVDVLLPFAPAILRLDEARRDMAAMDGKAAAATLAGLVEKVAEAHTRLDVPSKAAALNNAAANDTAGARDTAGAKDKEAANRAMAQAAILQKALHDWFGFYDGYDPQFTWWVESEYKAAAKALAEYRIALGVAVLGLPAPADEAKADASGGDPGSDDGAYQASVRNARPGKSDDIIGHAIGEAGLAAELANEMIAYTPRQLIAIAKKEFAWCDAEMLKASRAMGFGDDWHAALEKVKNDSVQPGEQPELVRSYEQEAERFVVEHDLVTVPALAHETWRRSMIAPQQQLISPFFLGGEVMQISYPTNTMTYAQRLTTMRANNRGMSHATVFHELIPGHELQLFMLERYRPYRRAVGSTPFLIEGWALYWELLLYTMGFQATPENRIGALAWRMHRCARIIFSLSFHLGTMTPQQCIDFLVARVGFEPQAAAGEVRRSFSGAYTPLYQAAYLLGGLQLRALHQELVPAKMTDRAFHDAVLRQNAIPVELMRAALLEQPLVPDYKPCWKFYGDVEPA